MVECCIKNNDYPCPAHVQYVYTKTSRPCRLRRFVVGLFTHLQDIDWLTIEAWDGDYPMVFLRDVMSSVWKKAPLNEDRCNEAFLKAELCEVGGQSE